MKRNGKNIITDQDITLTGKGFSGQTLDSTLTDHEERLDQIEGNVKWIYRNGRVGTGSGGGSGSGSGSGSWRAVITRVDTGEVLKDGTTLNLPSSGKYSFSIQVYKGGADTFSVQLTYQSSKGSQTINEALNTNNSFFTLKTLELDVNGTLTIKISNRSEPDEAPLIFSIPYITSSYSFNLYYVYADTLMPFNSTDNTIFISDVRQRGIKAALEYSVAVGIQSASYTYVDWEGKVVTVSSGENSIKEKTSNVIYLDLCEDIYSFLSDDNNAKYRQFLVNINLVLEGKIEKEDIPQLSLKDNLIPSNLFLRVTASGGTIYDSPQSEYPESGQFIIGTVVFQVTPFYGAIVVGRTYNFSVFLDDVQLGEDEGIRITTLTDQTLQSIPIPVSEAKEHKVEFIIVEPASGNSYTVDYWFKSKEATSSFTYYPRRSISTGTVDVSPVTTDVFRKLHTATNIEGLTELSNIQISSVLENPVVYNFLSAKQTQYNDLDQMICLGIQYVRSNDTSLPIAKFSISNGPAGDVYIYQNKVLISTDTYDSGEATGNSCEIYLPMSRTLSESNTSDYHLITIYKRLEKREGNNSWKGTYVYIDGVLEAAFNAFTAAPHNKYESVSFYPGNYYINLIESSSFAHSGNDAYESYLNDIDIQGYYYAYKEIILGSQVDEATKQLYDNFKTFVADEENFILTDQTAIYNIARYSEAPVLLMNFTDQGNGINGIKGAGKDCFKEYMSTAYEENDEPERASITIEYSPGRQEPVTIQKNGIPASFYIEPQGSSTKSFRCKNWEMYAPVADDEDHVCIYTPNFSESNTKTFLPEESFTLKADIVDSSHTNNNAVGDFVNDVATPFQAALNAQKTPTGERSKYAGYIKNCLTGFPVLVFLHTNYKSAESETELSVHNYYFLGIYNFNLGRKSYFNLGYKNTAALEDLNIQEGFGIYELPKSKNTILTDVMVAEVQGNNDYFDFSQYDTSILFKKEEGNDLTYMWGDFVNGSNSEAITRTAVANFVRKVSKAGGYIFDSIGKNFSNDPSDRYGYTDGYSAVGLDGIPKNQVPNYRAQAVRTVIQSDNFYDFTVSPDSATINDLRDFIITNEEDESREKGIDYSSLCEYYTICMAFGMVDSVEKNLNIKSWTAGREFYLAFYDMDTCLGVSNSGSKISYFAFSDYWDWANSFEGSNFISTKIYRDYSPKSGGNSEVGADSFYDVPSSYLFAIAKYAYFVLLANSTSSEQVSSISSHPNNLWALWRRKGGCLENASSFINKYYRHHLASIPEVAFNYNYRYKYFVRSTGNGFDTINFPKFYGRKIAYTETWLDNRLHILDAYFNINSINDLLTSRIMAPMVTNSEAVDTNNLDIYVLHDIFSTNTVGSQYANVQSSISAKAKSFAPLIIKTPNVTSRYMFPRDENQECGFNVRTSGNQTVLFGGSALWTELSSINPFITGTGSFSIDSDYFSVITGTGGAACNSWTFNTPSLKSLSLTNTDLKNALYSGNIILDGIERYPNLRSVRIDGTSINLTVSNSNITSVSALGMKTGSRLSITNTPNISDIRVSGIVGDLSLPGWGTNIRIPYDSSSISSNNITVQNTKYPGAAITISNAPNLTRLVLAGFSKITVYGCPKLTSIVINDVEDHVNFGLRTIDITMPSKSIEEEYNIESFTIGSVENVIDLSSWDTLENVRFTNLYTVEKVILPDHDVNLLPNAFSGCEELINIDGSGKRIILSSDPGGYGISSDSNTFYNAYEFTMRKSNGEMVDIYVSPDNTNLNGTFWISANLRRGRIDFDAAAYFLQTSCRDASHVKTCANLFRNQIIAYTRNKFAEEYSRGMCSLSLSNLSGCTDIRYVFRGCPVDAISRYMFTGLDVKSLSIPVTEDSWYSVSRGDNIEYVFDDSDLPIMSNRVIYTTTDFLEDIIEDIESINLIDSTQSIRLCFIEPRSSGEYVVLNTLHVSDVFNPGGKSPQRLYDLSYVEFFEGHKLDMQGVFTSNWGVAAGSSSGLRISYFMYYGTYRYFASNTTLDGLFKDIKLSSASFCLRDMNYYPGSVNMETFINWEGLRTCSNLFFSSSGAFSLGFRKHCSYSGFHNIWYNIITNFDFSRAGSGGGIGSVFQDLVIVEADDIPRFTLIDDEEYPDLVSSTARNISYLFAGINHRRSLDDTTRIGLHFTSDFLKPLPNIVTAKYAFTNTKWANPVPFNFFRKQTNVNTREVWVEKNGERVRATLTTFDYKKELEDITGCFSNVTQEENICYDPAASYNTGVTRKTIVDGDGEEYTEYYLSETSTSVQSLNDYGYTDCFGFTCDNPSASVVFGEDEWTNPVRSSNSLSSGVFCAPDVFYGVSDGGVIDECFNVSTQARKTPVFSGALPKHLVKFLSTTTSLANVFSGLNIWPIKFAEIDDPNESGLKQTYYYFVPSDFTDRSNLGRTFNFKLLIPDKRVTKGGGVFERPHYYFLLNTSVSESISSLDSSFPTGSDIKRTWSGNSEEEGSYVSIMGNPVYSGTGEFLGMETGIDYEKFYALKFDNIVLPGLAAIMSGDLVKGGQGAILWNKSSHLASNSSFAVILGINGLSTNAKLELPLTNGNFLSSTSNSEVTKSCIYNWDELEQTIDPLTGRPKYYPGVVFVD